jgi:hypothetical protein
MAWVRYILVVFYKAGLYKIRRAFRLVTPVGQLTRTNAVIDHSLVLIINFVFDPFMGNADAGNCSPILGHVEAGCNP